MARRVVVALRRLVRLSVVLLVGALVLLGTGTAFAQGRPGGPGPTPGSGPGSGCNLGAKMGGLGGMMGGGGFGGMMGAWSGGGPSTGWGAGGMMGGWSRGGAWSGWGRGGMMGGWYGGPRAGAQTPAPITLDQAVEAARGCVAQLGNPDLALAEIEEFQRNFYVVVKERSTGSGAFELLVNKLNGAVYLEPGPNMMWNTTYGHMGASGTGMGGWGAGGMMGGWGGWSGAEGAEPEVTADQAGQIAQEWLDRYQPGSAVEEPTPFPGYYTLGTKRGAQVTGMLSVNAYTGAVWYHSWHGAFVQEKELEG